MSIVTNQNAEYTISTHYFVYIRAANVFEKNYYN